MPWWQPIACPSVYLGEDVLSFIRFFCDDTGEPCPFLLSLLWASVRLAGLLVRAGELCTIIRISYLSPFFPFVLGVELWRYIQRRIQPSDRSMQTPHYRSSLRTLRRAAFGVTLMLPAKGWAQVDPSMANTQTSAKTSETAAEVLKREESQRILGVVPKSQHGREFG